jgi:hypothetical protein
LKLISQRGGENSKLRLGTPGLKSGSSFIVVKIIPEGFAFNIV